MNKIKVSLLESIENNSNI